jgi:hypothetical protein
LVPLNSNPTPTCRRRTQHPYPYAATREGAAQSRPFRLSTLLGLNQHFARYRWRRFQARVPARRCDGHSALEFRYSHLRQARTSTSVDHSTLLLMFLLPLFALGGIQSGGLQPATQHSGLAGSAPCLQPTMPTPFKQAKVGDSCMH